MALNAAERGGSGTGSGSAAMTSKRQTRSPPILGIEHAILARLSPFLARVHPDQLTDMGYRSRSIALQLFGAGGASSTVQGAMASKGWCGGLWTRSALVALRYVRGVDV